jgi:hypothetical protein
MTAVTGAPLMSPNGASALPTTVAAERAHMQLHGSQDGRTDSPVPPPLRALTSTQLVGPLSLV